MRNQNSIWSILFVSFMIVLLAVGLSCTGCSDPTDDDDDPTPTPTPNTQGMLDIATVDEDDNSVQGDIFIDYVKYGTGEYQGTFDPGTYHLSFGYVAGYNTPAETTVTVTAGETTYYDAVYTSQGGDTGTLNVWTTDENGNAVQGDIFVAGNYVGTGTWSGTLNPGDYTVSFGALTGYDTPADQVATVVADETTNVQGMYYTQGTPTGTLNVWTTNASGNIYVDDQLVGNSSWVGDVAVGNYKVSFGAVSGYDTPATVWVDVVENQTTYVEGVYTEQAQAPVITNVQLNGVDIVNGGSYDFMSGNSIHLTATIQNMGGSDGWWATADNGWDSWSPASGTGGTVSTGMSFDSGLTNNCVLGASNAGGTATFSFTIY